ncbi:hypothetical protein Tco_1271685 [Tanacetum coccineum]
MFPKLPNPFLMLKGFLKAQSLELNLDTRSIQLLQHNPLCLAARQPKVGLPKDPLALKLGNDASADFTTEADPEISTPNDSVPYQQGLDKGSKNNTLNHKFTGTNLSVLVDKTKSARDGSQTAHTISGTKVDTRSAFMDDEDHEDDPFITSKECNEEHAKRNKDTHAEPKSRSWNKTKKSLTTQVAKLKKHMWELPKEFLALPGQISLIQTHVKTLEALPGLSNNVTDTLNRFANILNAHNKGVPSAGKSTASHAEGEKNTNPVIEDAELAVGTRLTLHFI